MRGRAVGYLPFLQGADGEHLVWYDCPAAAGADVDACGACDDHRAFYGDRFFNSGERQRLIESVMAEVRWESDARWLGAPAPLEPGSPLAGSGTLSHGP